MEIILAAGAFVFGAILGSFINALSYRWGSGSIAKGRSKCMRCGQVLHTADLVPILSYLFLRGRCRYCGSRVSIQYPVVEFAAAVLSLAIFIQTINYQPSTAYYIFWLAVWMVLLFVVVYDLRHMIIPWSCSILLALLGLAHVWYFGFDAWSLAAGPALAAPLAALWLISGGRWMGLGDAGLMVGLGLLLGSTGGLSALVYACWIGAAVGIVLMLARVGVTIKTEVPFAPFLVVGAAVVHFLHADIFQTLPYLFL